MHHIMIIFSELFHGGAEKQFRELITGLDKKIFKITAVVLGSHSKNANKKLYKSFVNENPDIDLFLLNDLFLPQNITDKIKVFINYNKQIREIIIKVKPELIVVYSGVELSGSYTYHKLGVKTIFSERESGNRGRIKFIRYKFLFGAVDKIVCNSLEAQRYYANHNIKTEYIPNGIKISGKIPLPENHATEIVVPARISRVKNQKLMIRAAAKLNNSDIRISFIGKTEDEEYYNELKLLTKENNLEDKISFLPFTTDLSQVYEKSDIIILPSLMEGFTNVLLESYAFGRICLVSDIPMNRDVASPNQRFFNPTSAEDLANKINEIICLDDVTKQKEIDDNFVYVSDNFSINKMVRNYENIFFNIFNGTVE